MQDNRIPCELNYEQKLEAIKALSNDVALFMNEPGKWGCSAKYLDIRDRHVTSSCVGFGDTPADAVNRLWDRVVVSLPELCYVEQRMPGSEVKGYRWHGFMWKEIDRKQWAISKWGLETRD